MVRTVLHDSLPGSMPRVALESTVIAHGLPHPQNVATARAVEGVVRAEGATPRTVGLVGGEAVVGLTDAQIEHLGTTEGVRKVSLRDLPVAAARGLDGATTVAATMHLARRAGIGVFATGGIGGVHRAPGHAPARDVSADLTALARLPLVVVCAGAKAVLDLPATREALETHGVPVVGYQADEMPAFYSASSGLAVDVRCDTPAEVAALAHARDALGLPAAVLVTVPPPPEAALPAAVVAPAIAQAVREAEAEGLRAAAVTPFLLARVQALTGGRALDANRALLRRNARVAARIACALADAA
jgi:pseudouridine-5'-phosphate glycosidase